MTDLIIYIVEPDLTNGRSLVELLTNHGHRSELYSSGEKLLEQFKPNRQGILILALDLPGIAGIDLLLHLTQLAPYLPVIAVSQRGDVSTAVKAIKSGALTLVEKPVTADAILEALAEAFQYQHRCRRAESKRQKVMRLMHSLTSKEREVLDRLVEGMPNKQIARRLDIGLRTVELRRSNILKKFGVKSLAEAVKIAILYELYMEDNLVPEGPDIDGLGSPAT
ncbi:response regulator transcription factor [Lignipirellula cremea]|uniref:Transcriptional regulatory protein FixJ n=1 Tax=Lignipirellula cremea TaxID=2528010 RepID=A0A518E139_9BACT|nr:LuxR C-terminal-related transcriptional regulator [Lignipirellula cremea]QDU97808.1 Transcriptional regulatory protein FixJ [Lignipirellula cremea]